MRRLLPLAAALALLLALPAGASASVKWLCKPGTKDVCDAGLATTRFSPTTTERLGVQRPRRDAHRRIDCFYVYPTVSDQPALYANKRVDPEIRSIALFQAARFSQVCRVFAPVYRQRTIAGIQPTGGGARRVQTEDIAQADVREAWRVYLRRYNHGRGVVLIGHSQGAFRLRALIKDQIDGGGAIQRRIVSALLTGGNVVEGEFNGFMPCRTARQLGCVVAYSTYGETPPPDSLFGRSASGRVVCTNPARLLGGAARLETIFSSEPFAPGTLIATGIALLGVPLPTAPTPWISARGYDGDCTRAGGATFLKITPRGGAPTFRPSPTPQWGLHLTDENIALGDLVRLVRRQAAAYARRRG
ncbi:MAG TPA: DUF3089 domain-containing protein [Solirubrobacteraceae bacterium]|jgi:hypothetical protein